MTYTTLSEAVNTYLDTENELSELKNEIEYSTIGYAPDDKPHRLMSSKEIREAKHHFEELHEKSNAAFQDICYHLSYFSGHEKTEDDYKAIERLSDFWSSKDRE